MADTDLDTTALYLSEAGAAPLLTADQEATATVTQLVEHNTRLVISVAKHFQNYGLPLMDLIQEGNIGLIKAARKFDPTRARFSTLADDCIRHQIIDALKRQKPLLETEYDTEPSYDDDLDGVSPETEAALRSLNQAEREALIRTAAEKPADRHLRDVAVRRLSHPARLELFQRAA